MPLGLYGSSFTVGGTVYGFDVQTNSYGEDTQANVTIRAIPWSDTYTIIVQGVPASGGGPIGSKAVTRNYRAVVYSETDYLNLRGQRGQQGLVLTPREVGLGTGYQAVLMEVKRSDRQDPTNPAGPQTIEISFTMLQ